MRKLNRQQQLKISFYKKYKGIDSFQPQYEDERFLPYMENLNDQFNEMSASENLVKDIVEPIVKYLDDRIVEGSAYPFTDDKEYNALDMNRLQTDRDMLSDYMRRFYLYYKERKTI